ncbi:TIGR02677 family protein [Clostridium thermarum]|uniref:TIGR02677 family protein n=1 Tax=Clostridium thermarum TaxID=1716543 RepID=UPI00111FAEA6|nr:TIGR02677 family protein [Clostridium thermarum]
MRLDRNITKTIEESKYLSTENTWRYRTIIRTIYRHYEKMKYWLYKEDIYAALKSYEDFTDYTIDNLKSDLDTLVNWKNLNAMADTAKVNTIEEFKNREFRYQLSTVTIEIERMLITLENMQIENNATLEGSLVERFRSLLEKSGSMSDEEDKKVFEWWRDLNSSFKELNRNYQDYISKFYSPRNDELMKTTEFLVFKEGFIKYLREFIRVLQINTFAIREIFEEVTKDKIEELVARAFNYEKKIQSLDLIMDEREYKELNLGRFHSMEEWFMSFNGREALVDQLINNTNEVIRRITRYAAQIADKKNNNANRKEEYRTLAKLFNACKDIKEAHMLSSMVFGSFAVLKVTAEEHRDTESINSSIYEETPKNIIIKPRVRTYREKVVKNPIVNKGEKKAEKLKLLLEKRYNEEEIIRKYMVEDSIDLGTLPNLPAKDRLLILKLLTKGRSKKRLWNKGEFGMEYKVELLDGEPIKLYCEDGVLTMPHYRIDFRKEV